VVDRCVGVVGEVVDVVDAEVLVARVVDGPVFDVPVVWRFAGALVVPDVLWD
jgi:hypothetical protein